eukprot:scaffold270_cov390-Prasinococcus_capsulatus_cf.AAC.21
MRDGTEIRVRLVMRVAEALLSQVGMGLAEYQRPSQSVLNIFRCSKPQLWNGVQANNSAGSGAKLNKYNKVLHELPSHDVIAAQVMTRMHPVSSLRDEPPWQQGLRDAAESVSSYLCRKGHPGD